jgi:hypothetical protein
MKIKGSFVAAFCGLLVISGSPALEINLRGHQGLEVKEPALRLEGASELEERLAAHAFQDTVAYYRDLGFPLPAEASVDVIFQDPITIEGRVWECAHGVFDSKTSTIWLIRYASEQFRTCRLFGREPTPELYQAILAHEFAHFLNSQISPGLIPTIDEAIAATIQFELLEPALRKEILESYPIEKIRSVRDLCLSRYLNQPDPFLLACYCYNKEHPIMFRRFLEQRGPVLKDPFFID